MAICAIKEEEKEESVVIPGDKAFQALKHLNFRCKKVSLTFEARAMPKLEKLDLTFPHHVTPQFLPVGIEHLPAPTLTEINLTLADDDNEIDWDNYDFSQLRQIKSAEDWRTERLYKTPVSSLLKRAFKVHHPGADIVVCFDEGGCYDYKQYDSNDEGKLSEGVDNEERLII